MINKSTYITLLEIFILISLMIKGINITLASVLVYIIYNNLRNDKLRKLLIEANLMLLSERENPREIDEDSKTYKSNAISFITYKDCTVEKRLNDEGKIIYRILGPNGSWVNKTYDSELEAISEIDLMHPYLDIKEPKKRTVNNIRFVR